MKKYLAYYENEWPADIAELTAVENKPFVGYLKDQGVQFTVVPAKDPVVEGPADSEIWYKTNDNQKGMFSDCYYGFNEMRSYGVPGDEGFIDWHDDQNNVYNVISHEYNPQTGYMVIKFDKALTGTCLFWWSIAAYGGMPDDIFGRTNKLIELVLPTNIKHIGRDFCSGSSITSITIPASVQSIGADAFRNCGHLISIIFNGTITQWEAIEKANYWCSNYQDVTVHCIDGDIVIPVIDF